MSKANQKFVQADEAVSPVIGVILMVAITVVLAAVVFVLVSNLSKTSDKAEDAAFQASSPIAGQIHVTMIKMGTNGPYSIDTSDTTIADDVFVTLDGALCDVNPALATDDEEFLNLTGFPPQTGIAAGANNSAIATGDAIQWGAGEVWILNQDCSGTLAVGVMTPTTGNTPLASSTEHRIQVTVRGTLIFEGNVVVR